MTTIEYYAVPDPNNPTQITYWRRNKKGHIAPWPTKSRYGPALYRDDVPDQLTPPERKQWALDWYRTHRQPWDNTVHDTIRTDTDTCRARFAAFTTRCCSCARALTDPKSKTCGIGPECRDGLSEDTLAELAEQVGRLHAEHLAEVDNL